MTTFLGPRISGAESITPDGEIELNIIEEIISELLEPVTEETFTELGYILEVDASTGQLNNEIAGNTAASDAHTEWQEVYDLMIVGRPEYTVNQQVAALNTSATSAWSVAQSAYTANYLAIPMYTWLDPTLVLTENPVQRFYSSNGINYSQWRWYKTHIFVRVQFYSGSAGFIISNSYNYRFETSPNKKIILKNIFQFQPQSMFTRSNKVTCNSSYVGSGSSSCDVQQTFIRELQSTGRKFSVTVEYITSRTNFPSIRI